MKRKFKVTINDKTYVVEVEEMLEATPSTPSSPSPHQTRTQPRREQSEVRAPTLDIGVVKAPMPGVIKSINCRVNETIDRNHLLLVLEAMKMENEIRSPRAGTIKELRVSEGQRVEYGEILIVFE